MGGLYANGEVSLLEKVVEVLHANEKENMALNKNGLMTFQMNRIHSSTYIRIRKLLCPEEEASPLIE
jgi:hypothetical protein